MVLFDEINERIAALPRNFYSINSGGCGCMALILMPELAHWFPDVRLKVCSLDGNYSTFYEAMEDVEDVHDLDAWHDMGFSFWHIWLEFDHDGDTYAVDSDHGIVPAHVLAEAWEYPLEGDCPVDVMESICSQAEGWNWSFDRGQLPAMERMSRMMFSNLRRQYESQRAA